MDFSVHLTGADFYQYRHSANGIFKRLERLFVSIIRLEY